MFHEGNYEIEEFPIPMNGMNQFIAPDMLPSKFCYLLENIIPFPVGSGQVRYGTTLINTLSNAESFIIKGFPFITTEGNQQAVLYVNELSRDNTITEQTYVDNTSFSFESNHAANYKANTYIKVAYLMNAVSYDLYSQINNVSIDGEKITITLADNYFPDGEITIQQIYNSSGSIYCYDLAAKTLSGALKTGLSVACVPRAEDFQKVLLICNGVDKSLYWDGTDLKEIVDFVKEVSASNFTRTNGNTFSFNVKDTFNESKYPNGNLIELSVAGAITQLTINTCSLNNGVVTIVTSETLPEFSAQNRVEVYYRDWPPPFNFMYVANDRVWALGVGAVGLKFRTAGEALRVYYSYKPNSITSWFNETTKTVPSIDMSDKAGIADNFEAICQVNGLMAFMGRKKTQIWQGNTPEIEGNFSWLSTLDVGIVHGDLLIKLPNDVYFVSNTGIQSLSTLNIAKQVATSAENSVDTVIEAFVSEANISDANYRACRSFKYDRANIAGFKIANNKILASLFTTTLYSWFFLSGDFKLSTSFLDFGTKLYLSVGNKVYQYADGNDGSPKGYGDKDGKSLIPFVWVPGLIKIKGKRYANRFYEIVVQYPSSFTLNDSNVMEISINGDTPTNFHLSDKCSFPSKGDTFNSVPLSNDETGNKHLEGFRLNRSYHVFIKRFKFASSRFWITLSGYVIDGPVSFKRIRLFGIGERHG